MNPFGLMRNHAGYAARGGKRVLVRQYDLSCGEAPVRFRLCKADECLFAASVQRQDTFGCRLWVCDFSPVQALGAYTLTVDFTGGASLSCPVEVLSQPCLERYALPLAVDNARARYASGTQGKGYYDCNSTMGEAYSHGVYLAGLCRLLDIHRERWTQAERAEILTSAKIAFDYLMHLWRGTGEFVNCAPERAYDATHIGCLADTVDAAWSAAVYQCLLQDVLGESADAEIIRRLETSLRYALQREDANQRYICGEWIAPLCCCLYRLTGKAEYLGLARRQVLQIAQDFDWPRIRRGVWRTYPVFEGLYRLSLEEPEILLDAQVRRMLDTSREQLLQQMERNAFLFPAPSDEAHALREWEQPEGMLSGCGNRHWIVNNDVLVIALEACYLQLLTGDKRLARCAEGCLGYVFGMHFGIPGRYVPGAGEDEMCCASFMANTAESVRPWKTWYFTMQNTRWMSLINGYTVEDGEYFYTDEDWVQGETFIKTDGQLLHAAALYERMIAGDE